MTTKTEIAPNYTDVQITEMTKAYIAVKTDKERAEVVESLAKKFGKKINSIRAKLSNLKVYVKPEKVTKSDAKIERKADIITNIASAMNDDETVLESLEKGTKIALEHIRDFIVLQNSYIVELESKLYPDEQSSV